MRVQIFKSSADVFSYLQTFSYQDSLPITVGYIIKLYLNNDKKPTKVSNILTEKFGIQVHSSKFKKLFYKLKLLMKSVTNTKNTQACNNIITFLRSAAFKSSSATNTSTSTSIDSGSGDCDNDNSVGCCSTPTTEISSCPGNNGEVTQPSNTSSNIENSVAHIDDRKLDDTSFTFSDSVTLEDMRKQVIEFMTERDWNKFHTPRNDILDLVSEVGELAEIFQWKGEVKEGLPEQTQSERNHVAEELSDVLMCVVDLSHRCRIDLVKAFRNKMAATAQKYPANKCYGKVGKYTDY